MTKLANCDLGLGRVLVWKHSEDMRQWVTMLFVRIGIVFLTPFKDIFMKDCIVLCLSFRLAGEVLVLGHNVFSMASLLR